MAAQSSDAEPGNETGGESRWHHGAGLVRVTAIDLAVLAGHMLLYPTGMLPEHHPDTIPLTPAAPEDSADEAPDSLAGTPPDATRPTPDTSSADPGKAAAPSPRPAPGCTPPAAGAGAHPPVLLLHGFADNRSAFALLRRSLLRNGWGCVQALNYSPLTTDIRAAAEALGPHVEQICAQSGQRRVDIVAHSLGGLVARYYAQCLGGDARVRTLVTLGTPHSGTRAVPALSPHPLTRQMRPGSELLAELAAPAEGCRTRFVAFWSDLDQLMIPVEAARIEHGDLRTRNIKVSGIGHLSLPVHGAVAAEIRRELSEPGPSPGAMDAA
ncbi:esterase/lipase family protein [Streptomyces polygonati]|uniref:Esterase/lipase family protein n=1 Tax=Streptomyces polygonati TaxID=1617087 RepID=A0ABV8HLK4_9ACTN